MHNSSDVAYNGVIRQRDINHYPEKIAAEVIAILDFKLGSVVEVINYFSNKSFL
jgi:hypothetical protein